MAEFIGPQGQELYAFQVGGVIIDIEKLQITVYSEANTSVQISRMVYQSREDAFKAFDALGEMIDGEE